MSVETTLAALKTRFQTITVPREPRIVYDKPRDAIVLTELPCIVLALSPQATHSWSEHTFGGQVRHDYTVSVFVFVGNRQTVKLPELHSLVIGWPEALMKIIATDVRLGGQVLMLGDGSTKYFDYTIGPIAWSDGTYWGVKAQLPVAEVETIELG